MEARSMRKGAAAAIGATVVVAPAAAEAETFTVSNLDASGPGSLRRAVNDADIAAGRDEVVFQSGVTGAVTLAAQITVIDGVDIRGPGATQLTVRGDGSARLFNFYGLPADNREASISGLTLRDGSGESGGAVYGADTDLTIADASIIANYASAAGGAVYLLGGNLTVTGTTLYANSAEGSGGAIYAYGDPAASSGAVRISDSTLSSNYARLDGGGAYLAPSGAVSIARTTVSGNDAGRNGGGLLVGYVGAGASTTVQSTTISGNRAVRADGGGVSISGPGGPVTLRNTTISGNIAGRRGGGISSYNGADVPVTVANSTVVGNSAGSLLYGGGGIYQYGFDAGGDHNGDFTTLSSTIVADNTAAVEPDLGGGGGGYSYFLAGFSLVETKPTIATFSGSPGGSNVTGEDPLLGGLYDNGGATYTHEPYPGSPALDAGIANGLSTDQRERPRTLDLPGVGTKGSDGTDIGAVETVACQDHRAVLAQGTERDDELRGGDGAELILGAGGDDVLAGGGGGDCLAGAGGADRAVGGGGKDEVRGGRGRDRLSGGPGRDRLVGGGGRDALRSAGGGRDRVDCGPGRDQARVDESDRVKSNCERQVEVG